MSALEVLEVESDNEDVDLERFEENEQLDLERFEENEVEVEDGGEQDAAEEQQNDAVDDSNKKPVKPKKAVRNPQVILRPETLKGERGLIALESYFERVKFKGRGHEEEDLSIILKTYEYWCHRLFPRYPFDECVSIIENLGKKKPIASYVKRLRADLPYDYGPDIIDQNDDSENEDMTTIEIRNVFDTQLSAPGTQDLSSAPETQVPAEISEEQLERIRLNKERAEKIRREKLRQARESSEMLDETSGSQNLCSSPENGNTETVNEMEFREFQDDEPSHNFEESCPSSQIDDLKNHVSQAETHDCRENDHTSDESGDNLEINHGSSREMADNNLEENRSDFENIVSQE